MSSDKKFHVNVNNTDIVQQSEDGGGIKLTSEGKFIFGAKQQNAIDQLNEENINQNNLTPTVDVSANDQPFMAIINNNQSVDVNIANENINSLMDPPEEIIAAYKDLTSQLEDMMSKLTDTPVVGTSQDGIVPLEELPGDEVSYMESLFFNSVGAGIDGTGFEGTLTPEEIQKIIDDIDSRPYNK